MQSVKRGADAGTVLDRILQAIAQNRIETAHELLDQRAGIQRAVHQVGCAQRLRLHGLDMRSLVGDENDLAVLRFYTEPLFEFEQARAVSEIDVEQQIRLQGDRVDVVEIEKRQLKNIAELPADGFPLALRVGENSKFVEHASMQPRAVPATKYTRNFKVR